MSLRVDQPYAFISALHRDTKSITQVICGAEAILNDMKFLATVPLVRSGKKFMSTLPPSGTLVRARCMVQDIYGTELYDSSFSPSPSSLASGEVCTGAFGGDAFFQKGEFEKSSLGDRLVLACVDIPGESPWVRSYASSMGVNSGSNYASGPEEDDELGSERKRIRMDANAVVHELPNFIVKMYDVNTFESFKVNQVYEFVGILEYSLDEKDCEMEVDDSDAFYKSIAAKNPPKSIVPRIHSITFKNIEIGNGNPMFSPLYSSTTTNPPLKITQAFPSQFFDLTAGIRSLRDNIVAYLSSVLNGDTLVAEYVLLSLISRVYKRTETLPIGKLSLNITNCSQETGVLLKSAIEDICTKIISLDLSVDKLNDKRMVPFKDYDYDCLISTPLQYSLGTVLLIDETKMFPGQLTEIGLENVNGLKEIVQWQRLTYNFNFHVNEFPVDSPTISLSRCGWSILGKELYSVTLHLTSPTPGAAAAGGGGTPSPRVPLPLVPEKFFADARTYVSMVRELDYTMEARMRTQIQEHFVNARKVPQNEVTQESLHLWMTLARLVSLSYGESALTEESWKRVLELEDKRNKAK